MLYEGNKFRDFLFAFLHTDPLLKRNPLFRRDKHSDRVASLESVSILIKLYECKTWYSSQAAVAADVDVIMNIIMVMINTIIVMMNIFMVMMNIIMVMMNIPMAKMNILCYDEHFLWWWWTLL